MPARKRSDSKSVSTTSKKSVSRVASTALVTTNGSKTTFPTRVAIDADTRNALGMILNERLADFLDLERQAKQAHWNVKGTRFMPLHELFDATAALAVDWADTIAERAVQLGCVAEGTVQAIAARTALPQAPLNAGSADAWVHVVAEALAFCANAARADIAEADAAEDAVTTDILTRIAGEADKQLWFVEAHLIGSN
jgi:starvation-inducible DNA-binding protein